MRWSLFLGVVAAVSIGAWSAAPAGQSLFTFDRVSLNSDGLQLHSDPSETRNHDGHSMAKSLSADGRFVLFKSWSPDLGYTSRVGFSWSVRDRLLGRTITYRPRPGSLDWRDDAVLSADGDFVAVTDLFSEGRIQVLDRATGASVWTSDWVFGNSALSLSADGNLVAFSGDYSGPVVPIDPNDPYGHIFVHDRAADVTRIVSLNPGGAPGNGGSYAASISPDGQWIAFVSRASDLVANDSNGAAPDLFLANLQTSAITRIGPVPADRSTLASLSHDGQFVAFVTDDALDPSDTDGLSDVYVYDRHTGAFERPSASLPAAEKPLSGVPSISGNGRRVAFGAFSEYGRERLYWYSRQTGALLALPLTPTEDRVGLSADGCQLAFSSEETTLVPFDTNGLVDAFVASLAVCDDSPASTLTVLGSSATEGHGGPAELTFTVTLSPPASTPVSVDYATSDGSATAGADYLAASGSLTFAPGETTGVVTVPILGDAVEEEHETVRLTLTNPSGAAIGLDTALGTILDDDDTTPPVLNMPDGITMPSSSAVNAFITYVVSAIDNRDPFPVVSCTPPSPSFFSIGATIVRCTATDSAGNSSGGQFTVTVLDAWPPALNLPPDIVVTADSALGANVVYVVTATDNSDPSPEVSCLPPSGARFAVGGTTVDCEARDAAGNNVWGSFRITVRPLFGSLTINVLLPVPLPPGVSVGVETDLAGTCINLSTCTRPVTLGSPVRLTAIKRGGQFFGGPYFTGWTGCDSMNGDVCHVTISGGRTVQAEFSWARPSYEWRLLGGTTAPEGIQTLGFGVNLSRTADGRILSGSATAGWFDNLELVTRVYECGDFVSIQRSGSQVTFMTANGTRTHIDWRRLSFWNRPSVTGGYSCIGQIFDSEERGGRDQFSIQVFSFGGAVEFSWAGDADSSAFRFRPGGPVR